MAGHSNRFHFVLAFSNQSLFHECCQSPSVLDHRNLNAQFNRYTGISFVVGSPNPTLGNNFNSALVRLPRGNCCHGGYDWGTNTTLFGSASHLAHTFTLV